MANETQKSKKKKDREAQKEPNSQKSQSDEKNPGGNAPDEEAEKRQEQERQEAEERSREAAKGKGEVNKLKDGAKEDEVGQSYSTGDYDPLTDPIISSSHVAGIVKKELESLGESPTLQALHDNADRQNKASKGA